MVQHWSIFTKPLQNFSSTTVIGFHESLLLHSLACLRCRVPPFLCSLINLLQLTQSM
uniref:Uncharacterized protein n=1 Tax=Arundo donax TaxID=35708 RepID=A0A0A8ZM66_ARUDO